MIIKTRFLIAMLLVLLLISSSVKGSLEILEKDYCIVADHDRTDWSTCAASSIAIKLALIRKTEDLGSTVAEKLSKLKYISEAVEKWTDGELKGLARAMKHNEEWLKGISEADAKIAAKRIDTLTSVKKLADNDIKLILDTNIGRKTLVASDATEDLLAKQAKLASNWGAKELDKVANRFDGFWPWQKNGWMKVNELLNNVPRSFVNKLESKEAIKLLGDNKFMAAIKNINYIEDSFSIAFKSVEEIDSAVKKGLISSGTKKVYEGSVEVASMKVKSQNAASFANVEKETGAIFIKSEQDIERKVGVGNKLGADYVAEINNIATGISVKSPENINTFSKISDNILKAAQELHDVKKSTNIWQDHILNILVKKDDYANAVKYTDDFFNDPDKLIKLKIIMETDNFRVIITQVDDYLIV